MEPDVSGLPQEVWETVVLHCILDLLVGVREPNASQWASSCPAWVSALVHPSMPPGCRTCNTYKGDAAAGKDEYVGLAL